MHACTNRVGIETRVFGLDGQKRFHRTCRAICVRVRVFFRIHNYIRSCVCVMLLWRAKSMLRKTVHVSMFLNVLILRDFEYISMVDQSDKLVTYRSTLL